jgi:PAS domain S-box-containing protein
MRGARLEHDNSSSALADGAPVMMWTADARGRCDWCNDAWRAYTGQQGAAANDDRWADAIHPDDLARVVGAYETASEAREPFAVEMRVRRADGVYRWFLAQGTPRTEGYVVACTDVDDYRAAAARLRLLADIGDFVPDAFDLETALNRVARRVVPEFADLCTIAISEHGHVRRIAIAHVDRAEAARLRAQDQAMPLADDDGSALAEVARSGMPLYRPLVDAPGADEPWPPSDDPRERSLIVVPLTIGGSTLGACALVSWRRRYTPDDLVLAQEIAQRCATAADHARLYRASEEQAARLSLLASIGEQLAATLDLAETSRTALERIVPGIADFAFLVLGERNTFDRFDVRHVERDREQAFRDAHLATTLDLDDQSPPARAIRTGEPVIFESLPPTSRNAATESALGPLRSLGATSVLALPLQSETAMLGALVLGYGRSGRRYTANDLPLARDIARRVAAAVDRARTYVAERRIAETLQRSLLPAELPEFPDLGLCARYLPGERAEVGGDWYDVVPFNDGRVALVIGDVAGHGVRSAAVMGQLRNALRAFAGEGYEPTGLVERLNRFVFENGPDDMATLCYAVADPRDGTFIVVSAGHPPPIVLGTDGRTRWLDTVGGPPVGADPRSHYRASSCVLQPGDTVVLYTDGLVERRRESLDVGLTRLQHTLESTPSPGDLEHLCDHVTATLVPDGGADDVALLTVRYVGHAASTFRLRRPAVASELSTVRRVMSAWMESAGVPRDDIMLISVAVSEAVTNAVEHAYGSQHGWVEIEASRPGADVLVAVRDRGRWRPKAPGGGGRGLGLIGRLMDDFELRRTNEGTEVVMRRTAGPRNRL